ncbi:MAG: glycosyltransferase [Patescibacteria group bacterium]|nr:glycosyltransferase [Patescibacteria group bacterium]
MNIVFANKYYFPKGGAEVYMFDLQDLLVGKGHTVVPFAMKDGRNRSTGWSDRFVSPVETERVKFNLSGLKTAGRVVYSFEARRKFARLLREVKPDLVHAHNIYHQISPSILAAANDSKVPVVMTAHDYHLIAPNYSLFHDGNICEHTRPASYWRAVTNRCVKGSVAASALEAFAMSVHRSLGLYPGGIDRIIAPSAWMAAMLEEYGVDGTKIVHVPYYIDTKQWTESPSGDYALFIGRLSPEKGVDTLIRAAAIAKEVPVRIVGTGPEDMKLHKLAEKLGTDNVTFVGWKKGEDLKAEYERARFVVVPSVWYEVFGLVVFEAYASGKPVIATQMGGLSEIVRHDETGKLVSAGDAEGLASSMKALWNSQEQCALMGRRARKWVEHEFTPARHYEDIIGVYKEVMG